MTHFLFDDEPIPGIEIALATVHFLFLMREQPVLVGSGIIIPKRFVTTPFELNVDEWADLQVALLRAKAHIEMSHTPDGYNVGWNVGPVAGQEIEHLHLHVIPRFGDEPLAGRGIRYYIKQADNRRPVAPSLDTPSTG